MELIHFSRCIFFNGTPVLLLSTGNHAKIKGLSFSPAEVM